MNDTDSKILDIVILQFKLDSYYWKIFTLYNYFNNPIIQSKFLLFLWDVVSPDLLSNIESIEIIEEYYNKINNNNDENKNLFYKILAKIPYENRGSKIKEVLTYKENINLNININNFKNNIYNKKKIGLNNLRNIKNNLNESVFVESLILFFKR